jgi:hypothetical protein
MPSRPVLLLLSRLLLCPVGSPAGLYGVGASPSKSCTGQCPVGQYSLSGQGACTLCPAGKFADQTASTTSACRGPCEAGRYGELGQVNAMCTGPAQQGFFTNTSAVTPTENKCPPGHYW